MRKSLCHTHVLFGALIAGGGGLDGEYALFDTLNASPYVVYIIKGRWNLVDGPNLLRLQGVLLLMGVLV